MSSDRICTVCGQRSDLETCPRCDNLSRAPIEESVESAPDERVEEEFDYQKEVVYLNEESDSGPKGRKKFIVTSFGLLFVYGIPIMCVALAIAGRFRVLFTIAAIFGVQGAYVRYRGKRFLGPVIDDDDVRSRITPPLKELCEAAHVAVPQVRVKRTVWPAAVTRMNNLPTLLMSPEFLHVTDDSALRAILSHEVTHLRYDLPAPKKTQNGWVGGLFVLVYLSFFFVPGQNRGVLIYVALFFAFLFPAVRIAMFFAGFSKRKRETRADLEGAAAINDPDAMIRGLQAAYSLGPEMRRRIYGPKAFRWALFPYSLPTKIHPPLKKRVADLQTMSVPATLADVRAREDVPAEEKKSRVVVRIAAVAVAVALVLIVQHVTAKSPISPNVESSGGAHYMPLTSLGLSNAIINFAPLSRNQRHDMFITESQAVAAAESSEGVHQENGVTMTVAEGNVSNALLAGGGLYPTPASPDWQPAYIVVFSGPKLASEGFSGTKDVVIINAYQGTVLNTFIYDNLG